MAQVHCTQDLNPKTQHIDNGKEGTLQRTAWNDAIPLLLIVSPTWVSTNGAIDPQHLEMLLTERVATVLTFEGQEIDEEARGMSALTSNAQKRRVVRAGRRTLRHCNEREGGCGSL